VPTHLEDLENELVKRPQQVLVIAGAGVSIATDAKNPCASWIGLLRHGLKWCRERTFAAQLHAQLDLYEKLLETGDLLSVADFIAKTLRTASEGEYFRWLTESIGSLRVGDDQVIRALVGWGVQIATTNYDSLIEEVSGRLATTWRDRGLVHQFLRGDYSAVLHLHGYYQRPETVVFDARSYQDICQDPPMQANLQSFLATRTIAFVGCGAGLSDPNFGSLLGWSRTALAHSPYAHYRLVRECELSQVEDECHGLSIWPISYGSQYSDLGPFLAVLAERVRTRRTPVPELELLAREQANYLTLREQLEAERPSLLVSEYFRRLLELAQGLWEAGGHRQAALDLDSVFFRIQADLTGDERVRFGLELSEMLLEDGLERHAAQVLQPLESDVEVSDISPDMVARFRRLQVRCMNDQCAYREALESIDRALPHAAGEERARLQAQRGEIQLLQGELDEALRSVDSER
jgi:hypothetical protein